MSASVGDEVFHRCGGLVAGLADIFGAGSSEDGGDQRVDRLGLGLVDDASEVEPVASPASADRHVLDRGRQSGVKTRDDQHDAFGLGGLAELKLRWHRLGKKSVQ